MDLKRIIFFAVVLCYVQAQIIVYKIHHQEEAVATRELRINITVFNLGEKTVHDVKVVDSWSTDKFSVNGTTETKFDKIAAGSNATFSFVVTPKTQGVFESNTAIATYKLSVKDEETQTAYSNLIGQFYVDSPSSYDKRHSSHMKEWLIFLVLCGISVAPSLQTLRNARSAKSK